MDDLVHHLLNSLALHSPHLFLHSSINLHFRSQNHNTKQLHSQLGSEFLHRQHQLFRWHHQLRFFQRLPLPPPKETLQFLSPTRHTTVNTTGQVSQCLLDS
ncbi:hypothetical protein VIGAN_06158500 [Vigna angularis var. angularis]|uniref:Uncharacterized protein n=1 Tax=Vigna angularis var. angularis TaxID=157739 RepID=A0A0S3SBZ0_PHAAN|nr:hypothetical protein VIGAN_06158500 [Vigna angularis var. angularis]